MHLMKYGLTVLATLVVVAVFFYAVPQSLDFGSDFYDIFYSQERLRERKVERQISGIPNTIGRYALSGPTDRGVGIRTQRNCELDSGRICSNDIRAEYKNYINDFYAITVANYTTAEDFEKAKNILINLSLNKNPDQEYFVFEKHEIGWFSSEGRSFVLVQRGVCESTNNQPETCSYPYAITKDDLMIAKFKELYP